MHLNIGNSIFECFCLNFFKLCTDFFLNQNSHTVIIIQYVLLSWFLRIMLYKCYIWRPMYCYLNVKCCECLSLINVAISITLDVNSRIVWCLLSCFPVHLPPWHLSALLRGHILVRFSFSLFAYLFSVTIQYHLAFDVCSLMHIMILFLLSVTLWSASVRSKYDIWFNCLVMSFLAHILGDI